MASEHRPREYPIINPEISAALLRRLVRAWETADVDALTVAMDEACRLHGSNRTVEPQRVTMPQQNQ